jgi:inner membrane protein
MSTELMVWGSLALLLIAGEFLLPEVFLLWLGIAAAAVFGVLLVAPPLPLLGQAVLFAVFSVLSIGAYLRFFRGKDKVGSDQPSLNRRTDHFIGKVYVLETALSDGVGRIRIGDAFWTVTGPDLPAGTKVRVIAADAMTLQVSPEV